MISQADVRPPASSPHPVSDAWVLADLERWTAEEALAELLDAYGEQLPNEPLAARLSWLECFSARHWDFRSGRERDFIEHVDLSPRMSDAAGAAAVRFGMTGAVRPSRGSYSHILVLGGLARACVLRPACAADLVRSGLATGTVAGLAGFRPLSDRETALLEAAGLPAAEDEVGVMEHGLVSAFGLDGATCTTKASGGREAGDRLHRRWAPGGGPLVDLVAAPSPEPAKRRANTADTYAFWADEVAELLPGDALLLVTSSIYVPFQGCDAVRVLGLPRGVAVEAVGVDVQDERLGPLRQRFRAPHYLQELRSTVRSVRALYEVALARTESALG